MPVLRKMEKDAILAFWKRAYRECSPEITSCTIPFFTTQKSQPEKTGTGVLLQIGDSYFLVSAAHMFDYGTIHNLPQLLPPSREGAPPIHVNRVKVITSPVPEGRRAEDPDMREDDPYDIGVCELPDNILGQLLPGPRFARLLDVDMDPQPKPGCYMLMGYPRQFAPLDMANRRVIANPFWHITELYDGEAPPNERVTEIFLKYWDAGINNADELVTMPNPNGISGCGIWRLAESSRPVDLWRPNERRLVGIQHAWSRTRKYVRGTGIGHAIALIYEHYPSLRPAMDMQYARLTLNWRVW